MFLCLKTHYQCESLRLGLQSWMLAVALQNGIFLTSFKTNIWLAAVPKLCGTPVPFLKTERERLQFESRAWAVPTAALLPPPPFPLFFLQTAFSSFIFVQVFMSGARRSLGLRVVFCWMWYKKHKLYKPLSHSLPPLSFTLCVYVCGFNVRSGSKSVSGNVLSRIKKQKKEAWIGEVERRMERSERETEREWKTQWKRGRNLRLIKPWLLSQNDSKHMICACRLFSVCCLSEVNSEHSLNTCAKTALHVHVSCTVSVSCLFYLIKDKIKNKLWLSLCYHKTFACILYLQNTNTAHRLNYPTVYEDI